MCGGGGGGGGYRKWRNAEKEGGRERKMEEGGEVYVEFRF